MPRSEIVKSLLRRLKAADASDSEDEDEKHEDSKESPKFEYAVDEAVRRTKSKYEGQRPN